MRFVDLEAEAEAEEDDLAVVDLVVVCLALPFGLDAAEDGPALLDARLGGLKGSCRFFCAGPSDIVLIFLFSEWPGCHGEYGLRVGVGKMVAVWAVLGKPTRVALS